MKREDVVPGRLVVVSGGRDLGMQPELRRLIYPPRPVCRVIGLSKGGMAVIEYEGQEYRVPPRVLELAPGAQ